MFELRLVQGSLLKKVLEAVKDLVNDANFDCSTSGFSLQAMDSSHVALVSLLLRSEGFEHYRCDRNLSTGMNIGNMAKMIRCSSADDIITLKADDGSDTVTFMFESPSLYIGCNFIHWAFFVGDKLINIFSESLDIEMGLSTGGDIGTANIVLRQNTSVDKPEDATVIDMQEPMSLTFALRYMNSFTKATPLANQVTFSMSSDLPVVVEYKIAEMGYLRFYLAPKIEEEEEGGQHMEARPQKEAKPKAETKSKAEAKPKLEVQQVADDAECETVPETVLTSDVKPKVEPTEVEESKSNIKHENGTNGEVHMKPENETNGEAEVMDVE